VHEEGIFIFPPGGGHMMWFVYVISSLEHRFLYTGMSSNPESRLIQHNYGKVRSTKAFRPFKIVYVEHLSSREEARTRERYLKSAAGRFSATALGNGSRLFCPRMFENGSKI